MAGEGRAPSLQDGCVTLRTQGRHCRGIRLCSPRPMLPKSNPNAVEAVTGIGPRLGFLVAARTRRHAAAEPRSSGSLGRSVGDERAIAKALTCCSSFARSRQGRSAEPGVPLPGLPTMTHQVLVTALHGDGVESAVALTQPIAAGGGGGGRHGRRASPLLDDPNGVEQSARRVAARRGATRHRSSRRRAAHR